MTVRDDIQLAAAQSSWERIRGATYSEEYQRRAVVSDERLRNLAEFMGFELREAITVHYSESGYVTGGFLQKGQVIAWFNERQECT